MNPPVWDRYRRFAPLVAALACLAALAWGVSRMLERLVGVQPAAPRQTSQASPTPHITATLFFAAKDDEVLVPVRREVPLAEGLVAQGREILTAQLEAAPESYTSAIPEGTTLRAFYVTESGDAFVDLSPEVSSRHPGGSSLELLTVYALVNAVTANLPTIQRVQILIDGRQAETLAGHIDLRRPLERNAGLERNEAGTH
jgi:spore germination protein GerM